MTNGSVNTAFAGEMSPDGQKNATNFGYLAALAFLIASPLTALTAVGVYILFSVVKIKRVVIAAALGLYAIPVLILIVPAVHWFIESWTEVFPTILDKSVAPAAGIFSMLSHQFLIAVLLGGLLGLAYSSWRWYTRDAFLDDDRKPFKRTPLEVFRKKRTLNEIRSDENGPDDGTTIGITADGKRVVQTDKEASAHTFVVGASGSGKTTLLMSKARDAIRRGQGMVFIDLKGGHDVPDILSQYAKRYNRKLTHWLLQSPGEEYLGPDVDGPAYYDPLARGDATRRKDLLIASRTWSEEHYKIQASSYLQLLFNVLIGNPKKDTSTLSDVVNLLTPTVLQQRAIPLGTNPRYQDVVMGVDKLLDNKISATKLSAIEGLGSQLETLLHSTAGPWLQVDTVNKHNINLFDAAHNGEIVVFSLDSSNYPELASLVANLIIQDLKTVTSELRANPLPKDKPFQVFVDEFSAIEGDNIIGLINKARDANMPVTLATQALADLEKFSPAFRDQILGIINCFIVHRPNTEDDAKIFSGLTGQTSVRKMRQSVEYDNKGFGLGRGSATGSGSLEEIDSYRVMPTEFLDLEMGQNIFITKSPLKFERVTVIPEMDKLPTAAGVVPVVKAAPIGEAPENYYGLDSYVDVQPDSQDVNDIDVPSFAPGFGFIDSDEAKASQEHFKISDYSRKPGVENMERLMYDDGDLKGDPLSEFPKRPAKPVKPTLAKPTASFFAETPIPAPVRPVVAPQVTPVTPPKPVEHRPVQPKTPKPPKKDEFDF